MIPPIRWRWVPIECATPPGLTSMRPGAVRPIVPMRSDRIGPGAVRLPLRAAAGGCIILLCMFYMLYMSTRWRSEP